MSTEDNKGLFIIFASIILLVGLGLTIVWWSVIWPLIKSLLASAIALGALVIGSIWLYCELKNNVNNKS